MRVALVPGQHAQQDGSQDVRLGRGVWTAVAQRAVLDPLLPQIVGLQKLQKVRHWSECRHRRLRIPANENLAAEGLHRFAWLDEIVMLIGDLQFTLRVSRNTRLIVVHPSR